MSITSWLSGGTLIALATAGAYLLALTYETAFCQFFGIPLEFISLSTTLLIARTAGLFFIFMFLYDSIGVFYDLGIINTQNRFMRVVGGIVIAILVYGIHLYLFWKQWNDLTWLYSASLIVLLIFFVLDLIPVRRNIERNRLQNLLLITFMSVLAGFQLFHLTATTRARYGVEYFVINQSPKVVVLRSYGDNLIAAPLIRGANENHVEQTFYILKLSEMKTTPLTLEKVGPLTVKESSKTAP
jgi:hypothetical protein